MQIELRKLCKSFGGPRALDEVTFSVAPGQLVAVLGPNGAGKTTLLRTLAGIVAPDSGEVQYNGERFHRGRVDLRRRFFFMPDVPPVFPEFTVLRHISMVLRIYGTPLDGIEERVVEYLRQLDMQSLADAPLGTLSRGQLYKAALTALFAVNPELWLLDEPFASGMDPGGINAFKRRAREALAAGHTVIYSTQLVDLAERFSDKVCVLHRGKMHTFATVDELKKKATEQQGVLEEIFLALREHDA